MRAAVAQTEQHVAVAQDLGHPIDARVERLQRELILQVIGERHVEERIHAIHAALGGDVGHRASLEVLQLGRPDFMHGDALPIAERRRALQILAEGGAERRIAIHPRLRALRLVDEHALPRGKRGEGEGIAHVDLARERKRRGLRPRAFRDQRPCLGECLAHRFGQVVAVEHGDEGDRPLAFVQHELEQLKLRRVEHRDLARHRELDRALAPLAQHVAIRLELFAAGVAAAERSALIAEVLVEQRAGKAEGAGVHRNGEQSCDVRDLGAGRGAFERRFAHHVVPQRR